MDEQQRHLKEKTTFTTNLVGNLKSNDIKHLLWKNHSLAKEVDQFVQVITSTVILKHKREVFHLF